MTPERVYPDGWTNGYGTSGHAADDTLRVGFAGLDREDVEAEAQRASVGAGCPMEVFEDADGDWCFRPALPAGGAS